MVVERDRLKEELTRSNLKRCCSETVTHEVFPNIVWESLGNLTFEIERECESAVNDVDNGGGIYRGQKTAKTRARKSQDVASRQPKRRRRTLPTLVDLVDQSATAGIVEVSGNQSDSNVAVPSSAKRRRRTLTAKTNVDSNNDAVMVPGDQRLASERNTAVPWTPDSLVAEAGSDAEKTVKRRCRRTLTAKTNIADSDNQSAVADAVMVPSNKLVSPGSSAAVLEVCHSADEVAEVAAVTTTKRRSRRSLTAKTNATVSDDEVLTGGRGRVRRKQAAAATESTDDELPPFNMVNSSFTVGDLIWIKFRKHPFWPALVSSSFLDKLMMMMMMMTMMTTMTTIVNDDDDSCLTFLFASYISPCCICSLLHAPYL